jgi:hypothetical protein
LLLLFLTRMLARRARVQWAGCEKCFALISHGRQACPAHSVVARRLAAEAAAAEKLGEVALPRCRVVALSRRHVVALSRCRFVAVSPCRLVALSRCRFVPTPIWSIQDSPASVPLSLGRRRDRTHAGIRTPRDMLYPYASAGAAMRPGPRRSSRTRACASWPRCPTR